MLSNARHTGCFFLIDDITWDLDFLSTSNEVLVIRLKTEFDFKHNYHRPQDVLSTCVYHINETLDKFKISKIIFITENEKWTSFFSNPKVQNRFYELTGFKFKSSKQLTSGSVRWVFTGKSRISDDSLQFFYGNTLDHVKSFMRKEV